MEINRRFFESLMQDKGLSLRGLAQRMGMSHSQLSLAFSGDRKLQIAEAVQLSSIFGVPLAEVIEASGVPVGTTGDFRVPVIGAVQGDGTVMLHKDDVRERAKAPEGAHEDTIAVQCRTAGSPLEWMDGWVMFARKPKKADPTVLGRYALVQIEGGPAAVAGVRRGYRERTYNLIGTYRADSVRLEWATPIDTTRN